MSEAEELEQLQREHAVLSAKRQKLRNQVTNLTKEIGGYNTQMSRLGNRIYALKQAQGDVHITDHAIVRYLERYQQLDVWEVKAEIIKHKNSVKVDNTIVTVNGETDEA